MPKIVEIPGLGNVEFPDSMSDAQINSAIETDILPKIGKGSAPAGRGGILPSFAEGFATSFTDIPLGIAGLYSAKPEETALGKFSTGAEKVVQDILGIDPTKEATTAESVAGGLGSLASFLVPGTLAAKGARALGAGAQAARAASYVAAGAQAAPLGAAEQVQRRMAEEASTGVLVPEQDRIGSQLLGGAIGLSELATLGRFFGPLEKILAKVPLSKAGGAGKVVEGAVKRALVSATEEGAQEALAQGAQNLVEQGYYNPDLDITEGLLSSAGVGGAAGGTLDVVLQLMAGRKAGKMRTAFTQLERENARQAAEKTPERIRADAIAGRDELLRNAPSGEIKITSADNTETGFKFKVVDASGKAAATFDTKDAAVLAAEQYERDNPGAVTFIRPTIAEAARTTKGKPTKQEKKRGKKIVQQLEAEGSLQPAPAQLPTTPAGQATTGAAIAETIQQVGATPTQAAEIVNPAAPKKGRKKRIAPVEAPVEAPAGAVIPEGIAAPPPVSTTAAEIPAPPPASPATMEFGTADERAAIRREIAPQAETFRDMTPEQQAAYNAELDRRYPGRSYSVFPTPTAPQATPTATPTAAPVSPSEAPPAAVQPVPAAKPPKEFKPSVQALFKPVVTSPDGVRKLQEFEAKRDEVAKALNTRLAPIVGSQARVQLVDVVRQGKDIAEGEVLPAGDVIYLSYNLYDPNLTTDQMVDKLFDVMNHEVIHSLSNLGLFRGNELPTLFKAAERIKYQGNQFTYYDRALEMYKKVEGYRNPDGSLNEEMIHEEAVAEMFRDARAGKLKLEGTPKGVFGRIVEFFKRLFNGYRDAKVGQIFKDIEAGKMGAREARPVEGGVQKLAILAQPGSDSTQVATTTGSYRKAAAYIKETIPNAKNILDYGAGRGLGSDAMRQESGVRVDSYEPIPTNWQGKARLNFNNTDQISEKYDGVVNLNVLNVLEPKLREEVVRDIISKIAPGGAAVIGVRKFKGDIEPTKNSTPAQEEKAIWVKKPTGLSYQKGFDGNELVDYLKGIIPPGYTVERGPKVGATSAVIRAPKSDARKFSIPAQLTGESEQEFARWWKQSKAVDSNGMPQVFYHGRPRPLREGQFNRGASGALPGEEGPYFFSTSKRFAEDYALFDRSKFSSNIESETGVMYPVYLSVQNPFDYESASDMRNLAAEIKRLRPDGLSMVDMFGKNGETMLDTPKERASESFRFFENLDRGSWRQMENPIVQRAIRNLGYDGFYLRENAYKNLAVYKPQQIKSIFNQFEPGSAESRKLSIIPSWTSSGYPPPGINSNDANENSPYRVSQRFPTATRATENALTEDLRINLEAMMRDPVAFAKNMELIRNYDGFPFVEGETPEQTAQRFKSLIVENLLALYDAVDPKIRKRSKLWYVGARRIATEWSKKYNLPDSAIASVIANLSPQMDWFQNVSVAERVLDVVTNQRNFRYTDKMEETAKRIYAKEKYEKNLANIRGKTFGELTDSVDKAMWLRIFDETYNDTGYRIVSPEGYFMDYAKNLDGSNTKIAWKSNVAIAKAIESIENPTKENINTLLGQMHKVRNFYNNILSPGSSGGDVTIDTHAVAAALWRPLSGTSLEVDHNFGSTSEKGRPGTSNSSITGVQGLYGIYADAYREAAMARNVLPREMQSITWEAVRSLYPDTLKSNKKTIAKIDALWNEYKNGSRTAEQVRKELTDEYGKSISVTAWSGSSGGVDAKKSDTSYTPKLSGSGVSGGAAGVVGGIGEPSAGGNPKQIANQIAAKASKPNISDSQLEDLAVQANEQVRKAVRKLSTIPQPVPMPPEMEDANRRIFAATHVPSTPGEKLMGVLGGLSSREGIGNLADMFRVYYVQKTGQITKRERVAFLSGAESKTMGKFAEDEAQFAEYSATGAADMMQRSSHYTVEAAYNGAPVIRGLNAKREAVLLREGGDPNSAYMFIEKDQADSPLKVLEMIITGGPNGGDLTEQFRSYALAQVSKRRLEEGKEIPEDITQEYIDEADALAEQYPIIKQAFESYQRFNKKLLEAVRDSGYLSQELFEEFTDQQNYYSMYRQLEEGDVVQELSGGLASRIRFKAYEGSTTGNLMADPIVAMMHNVAFWNNVILRTIATQKAFRVGEATGVVKKLRAFEDEDGDVTIESPSRAEGYDDKVFYTYINGVEVPFASKDPLFTIGLSGNDFVSPGTFLELAGMPADFLREMVTRDPGFMVANLMRDSVSTWVLAGSGANPFQTFKGFISALNSSSSFEALRSYGVVGSFDEAQKPMAKIVAGMRQKLTKVQGLPTMTSALSGAWNKLGSWSEASDAATRIAVYEAAKRSGASDFTAAYRALSIMNFSRSGHSAGLRMWTRMVPFLNARIQGFDVLYTGLKSATGVLAGREQLSFERQRGTHVLVRGMALTAAAMALSLLLEDDEDYQQLPQYIKDANILIPIPGEKGKYFQIPKPFEAGFLFMTVPQTFYDVATGNRSMRSATKLMFNQFSSTFGFNPIPQAALPIVENMINRDFYTGQPLISPGMEQLETSLQYNASTSYVARGLSQLSGFLPINYDFEEGRFVPISPIKLDNLISGYGGPIMSYIGMGIGGAAYMFGADNQGLPVAGSQLPVIRRFFVDARDKQPQAATEAYELYQLVDKVTRTVSRLKKMGDTEALKEYREENINILRVGKQVRKMADNLNNIRAQIRRLEADKVTPMSEKLEKLRELRSREIRVTRRIDEINQQLGR